MSVTTPVVDVPLVVVEDVLPAPVVEFFAPVSGVTNAAPAPVVEFLAPALAPAVRAAPAPVTEFAAPVLADFLESPVPVIQVVQGRSSTQR